MNYRSPYFFLPFFNGAPLQHIGKQSKGEKKSRERSLAAFREWASEAVRVTKALFSWMKFGNLITVALSFLFDN